LNDQARESKRAADTARLRYREGLVDFLSLLDAEHEARGSTKRPKG
jgi:outer membrane protein TolC